MNFLYLLIASFLLIATSAIRLAKLNPENYKEKHITTLGAMTFSDLPVINEKRDNFPVVSAQSVMAVDLDSGVTLYEKDPQRGLLPASTTKIVTALVVLDEYDLNQVVTVPSFYVEGQKMGLVAGEKIKVIDLLSGMLIYSANDAAETLARVHRGGRDFFISLMNKRVKDLGLVNSNFTNPAGLDDYNQKSNVRDLVAISRFALKNPVFAEIVSTKEKIVKSQDGKYTHRLVNTNKLLWEVEGVLGVKTGWTENARENLVTYIQRDGRKVMVAVLGSQDRFGETKELLDWIFLNYTWTKIKI